MKKQYTPGEIYILKQTLTNGGRAARRSAYRILQKLGFEIEVTQEPSGSLKTVYKIVEKVKKPKKK